MAPSFQFWTPARQIDFPDNPNKQAAIEAQWNVNLDGFTRQGITGNPWNATNSAPVTNYVNPLTTPLTDALVAPIEWSAFPGRIGFYFPQLSSQDVLSLADTGYQTDGQSFPPITQDPCSGESLNRPFGPYGPRGWQDEYCEWSVTRNAEGKITRIDFTCENPEYWNTLWMVDPKRVLELYRSTLEKPQIQLEDLYLRDSEGHPVIDPTTGRPGYNPLNPWNCGPVSTETTGGAMHLTSTPNTLQTEIGLASAATIQRTTGNSDPTRLICCAQYGQPHRNSDPHIGQVTNQLVGMGKAATLTNPPGLYIQMPNLPPDVYVTPDGTDPLSFWTILRGTETLQDESGNPLPGNFILHAKYEVPAEKGYTISDIKVDGSPIQWGGQIAQAFTMHIVASAITAQAPAAVPCVGTPSVQLAQPLQLFHRPVFDAMAAGAVPNPVGQAMTLISNSTLIAPIVPPGATSVPMALTAATVQLGSDGGYPTIAFDGEDIKVNVTGHSEITYAVPGNSYPSPATVLYLEVSVAGTASIGLRGLRIQNEGQPAGPAMPGLLNIGKPGTSAD